MPDFDPTLSTPAGGDIPAPPAPASTGAPASPVATPQGTSQPPAIGGASEDRSNWVPPHRLREATDRYRQAEQTWQQRETQYQTEMNQIRQQLQALVGVQPPQNPEIDAVRKQFAQLFPRLAKLEERGEDVFGLLERAGDLESQTSHYWQSYGRQTMDRLFSLAQDVYGGELSADAKRVLHSSFVGYVQSSPELSERYAQDPHFVEEFWKAFSSNFVDPARRATGAGLQARAGNVAALPQDIPGQAPQIPAAPKPANLDERADRAWALYKSQARQ